MMVVLPETSRILVTLELPEPQELSDVMVRLLGSVRVLLVGWYEVPEQTSPEQAREEVEDTGEEALEEVADDLREAGAEVETRIVFTPDPVDTVQRLGAEQACDAALIAGPLRSLERVLVVLRESVSSTAVGALLSDLLEDGWGRVTLLHVSREEADEGRDWSRDVLDRLDEVGLDTDRVETRIETAEQPDAAVLAACQDGDYDLVVIPEAGELEDRLFGSFAERVAREADLPVLVVRGRGEA